MSAITQQRGNYTSVGGEITRRANHSFRVVGLSEPLLSFRQELLQRVRDSGNQALGQILPSLRSGALGTCLRHQCGSSVWCLAGVVPGPKQQVNPLVGGSVFDTSVIVTGSSTRTTRG